MNFDGFDFSNFIKITKYRDLKVKLQGQYKNNFKTYIYYH